MPPKKPSNDPLMPLSPVKTASFLLLAACSIAQADNPMQRELQQPWFTELLAFNPMQRESQEEAIEDVHTAKPQNPWDAVITYTGDSWHNTQGGTKRGGRYVSLLSLAGDIHTEQAWGHSGGLVHSELLFGRGTFGDIVGEAQAVDNIDFGDKHNAQYLYELWYEQTLNAQGSSIKTGLYDVNSEFYSIDSAGLFINSALGTSQEFAQSGVSGPSVAPLTGLALRGLWAINPGWTLKAAIVDGTPGSHNGEKNNHKPHVQLRASEGALLIAEANYSIQNQHRFGAGKWHYTRRFDEPYTSTSGERAYSEGAYVFADTLLKKKENGEWRSFASAGMASAAVNQLDSSLRGGVKYTGLLVKADDELGFAIASAHNGHDYRHHQHRQGTPTNHTETAYEITYRTQVTHWLALQPDIQYIANPSADPNLKNALALGVRFEIAYGMPQ